MAYGCVRGNKGEGGTGQVLCEHKQSANCWFPLGIEVSIARERDGGRLKHITVTLKVKEQVGFVKTIIKFGKEMVFRVFCVGESKVGCNALPYNGHFWSLY